jgi:hypothetical protein
MKIKLKETLKGLDGKDLKTGEKTLTIGEVLANIIINAKINGKMKVYSLAHKAYNDEVLELDEADKTLVKNILEADDSHSALATGQLLVLLENEK